MARELKVYLDAAMQDAHMPQSARKKLHLLEVLPVFGLVSYTSASKDQYVTHENLEKFQPKQLRLDPFFRKSSAFQCEKEFRFIWLINLGCMENNDFDLTSTALRTVDLKGIAVPISRKPFSLEGIYDRRGTRIA
ncbi:hypothetical protein ICN48_04550 [Polynucleobacter sp. JS-Safj-400b-B2]|uniref:hypothetical protein n=1 Tax=Polynucleobacter sp. JS-Safj-400b-B2 TaxID=2576921 RepID=UPI001C0C2F35|nr:hypothetical protein [Polynucleobacter sp. JS-Safj-400b-B2]MBU3625504.1 hypothetical protein [Polynucleobacter sp. JS-Safj-400b-B2]